MEKISRPEEIYHDTDNIKSSIVKECRITKKKTSFGTLPMPPLAFVNLEMSPDRTVESGTLTLHGNVVAQRLSRSQVSANRCSISNYGVPWYALTFLGKSE